MPMNKHLLLLAFCGLLLLRCGFEPVAGGSTDTELGSTVTGMVYDDQGKPASHAQVALIPQNYNPVIDTPLPDNFTDTTDSIGTYVFSGVPQGDYTILAAHQISNSKLLITGIAVSEKNKEVVTPDTLRQTGSIAIEFSNPDSVNGFVYIPGTTFFTRVARYAVIEGVPSGRIPAACYTDRTDTTKSYVIDTGMNVVAGRTVSITDYHAWCCSRRIFLNTSATGADVRNDVTGFPVLVRLTGAAFDFGQAKGLGEDLRFTKPDGSPLPYEIERWDSAGGRAEIWVSVDTVRGNNDMQYIVMLWGNSNAADNSNGAAVFDTGADFKAVCHLNQTCDDVTYGGNNGTNYGAADTTGIIGYCKKFDGSDSIKITGLLGSPASVTLSAWAQLDSVSGGYGAEILSIGDAVLIRMDFPFLDEGTMGAIHPYGDTVFDVVTTSQFLKQTGWHLVTFAVDQNNHSQTLYIDGSAVASENYAISIDYSRVGQNTFIGTHGNGTAGYNFSGSIDEVRVYRKAISADYVKLSFMNQRQDDRLVTIK
jgi:hypothetical protein